MYRTPELKIEIKDSMDAQDVHVLLARALEFPDYYGHNWDAFEECLNDDSACNPPEILIVRGWDTYIKNHENEAKQFWSCIDQRGNTKKAMEVFVSPRACPCCGYLTLKDWNPGSFELCHVCNWEDDFGQSENPSLEGGANYYSLIQAQNRYQNAISRARDKVNEVRDFRWGKCS